MPPSLRIWLAAALCLLLTSSPAQALSNRAYRPSTDDARYSVLAGVPRGESLQPYRARKGATHTKRTRQMTTRENGTGLSLEEIGPPEDRVQVYSKDPRYIQYKGKPVFLVGSNQGWTASLQDLDHDYQAEFDALQAVGGNLVRITPFIGQTVDESKTPDVRGNNLPWKQEEGQYLLDLESHGGNPLFWDRLAELAAYAYARDIVVSFEFWDLYSTARGPGGNLNFGTPPGNRWSAHPFAPGNSRELAGGDALPVQTHMKDIAFCRTVTEGAYGRALELQEQYVKRLLDVLSPYPNIIYCMVNETSAEKAWSDYWLRFTHRYFEEEWGGVAHLVGEMPREFKFTENFTVEQMLDDRSYGFADVSQYCTGGGLTEMGNVKVNTARFRAYREEQADRVKPMTCMKIYNVFATSTLWMRLFAGCATARYHRVVAGLHTPPEGVDPVQGQLSCVGHVAGFIADTGFEPWTMVPDAEVIAAHPGFELSLAMVREDGAEMAALLFCEAAGEEDRAAVLTLPPGRFEGFWLDPLSGARTALELKSEGRARPLQVPAPRGLHEAVIYLKQS